MSKGGQVATRVCRIGGRLQKSDIIELLTTKDVSPNKNFIYERVPRKIENRNILIGK